MSADNSIPERHIVIETLRKAAQHLGLKPPVLATLDALISCLPPKRAHHTVFASNATLVFRRNGISDRTLRRHVATLQECGLLERRDSPNRKRYSRNHPTQDVALRFGFDLAPLYDGFANIAALAAQATQDDEQRRYLKLKIRTAAHEILANDPQHQKATHALQALRRKLELDDCLELLNTLCTIRVKAETTAEKETVEAEKMSANDGQNVRHYQNSNKELKDKKENTTKEKDQNNSSPVTLAELIDACPNTVEFSLHPIRGIEDVVSHARTLAPMIGIDDNNYQAALQNLGPIATAVTVWGVVQMHKRIHKVGAYFRSITSGKNKDKFDPNRFIKNLLSARLLTDIQDIDAMSAQTMLRVS